MSLRLFGIVGQDLAGMQKQIDAAMAAANAAQATGTNARNMVLTRDATLATLSDAAAQLPLTQASAQAEHEAIRALITALTSRVAGLEGKAVTKQEKRVATTTLLALGATTDLTVTWTTPFPDANYLVIPLLDASTGVANVNPPALKSQTKDGCVISVRANVAVAAGLAVNVIGLRFG